ncbi:MAG: hypothetical protein KA354_17870 [Phycisphaerae bacterium]|nr:hypothetical protein [Phycisphaerae bacterium]
MSDTNRDPVTPPPPPPLPPYSTTPPVCAAMPYATRTQESNWPKVIGIIAVVFAIFGIVGGVCGLVSWLGMSAMQVSMPSSGQVVKANLPVITEMGKWRAYTLVAGAVSFILQIVLLVSAIHLMKRRRWTIPVLRIWACLYIFFSLIGTTISYHMQKELYQQLASGGGPQGSFPMAAPQALIGLGMLFGILWACALPVFVLIWFSRQKIKAETATWV